MISYQKSADGKLHRWVNLLSIGINNVTNMGTGGYLYPDQENPDNGGALKVNGNSETGDGRTVLGIVSIQVADLLISGISGFIEYIYWGMKLPFRSPFSISRLGIL